MITKKSKILFLVCACFGLAGFVHAEQCEITDVIHRNDPRLNKKEKSKSFSSLDELKQLTLADMQEINSGFEDYSNSLDEKTSTRELFEIISAKPVGIILPDDCSPEYSEQRQKVFVNHEKLVSKARKLLANQGDVLIEQLIVRGSQDSTNTSYSSNAIKILAEIGTPRSKQTLINIIDLKVKGWDDVESRSAMYCYLQVADPNEASELISTRGSDVLEKTIRKFPELAKEPAVFDRLCKYFYSTDFSNRMWVIGTFMYFPPEEKVPERVNAIAESLKTVHQIPNANDRYAHDAVGTRSDILYAELSRGLMNMGHADNDLVRITNEMDGLARKWIIATRANRGDASVKEEVISILKDQSIKERTKLRLSCVMALGEIGTREDIPFLKYISENDTYEFLIRGGPVLEKVDGVIVNNTGERSVAIRDEIVNIDLWTNARKDYPIREAARLSIAKIQSQNESD
jgi:hypothetical protein